MAWCSFKKAQEKLTTLLLPFAYLSTMKTYPVFNLATCREDVWGVGVYIHALLTSALDGSECSASRHDRFTQPRK
jgi:hypothetical protein